MTQNTQTTAERIARLIDENYQIHGLRADYETAKIVARELDARQAQIDALTRERDEARAWKPALDEAVAALTAARAEVARLRPAAEAWRRCHGYAYVTEAEARAREAAERAA